MNRTAPLFIKYLYSNNSSIQQQRRPIIITTHQPVFTDHHYHPPTLYSLIIITIHRPVFTDHRHCQFENWFTANCSYCQTNRSTRVRKGQLLVCTQSDRSTGRASVYLSNEATCCIVKNLLTFNISYHSRISIGLSQIWNEMIKEGSQ